MILKVIIDEIRWAQDRSHPLKLFSFDIVQIDSFLGFFMLVLHELFDLFLLFDRVRSVLDEVALEGLSIRVLDVSQGTD